MRTWRDSAAEAGRAALPLGAAAASDGIDAERDEESTRCASTSRKATSTGRSCAAFAPPASMTALPFEAAMSRTCESERDVALGSDGAAQTVDGEKRASAESSPSARIRRLCASAAALGEAASKPSSSLPSSELASCCRVADGEGPAAAAATCACWFPVSAAERSRQAPASAPFEPPQPPAQPRRPSALRRHSPARRAPPSARAAERWRSATCHH